MSQSEWRWLVCGLAVIGVTGCHRAEPPHFSADVAVKQLKPELQTAIQDELVKRTGTFLAPKMLAPKDEPHHNLSRGQAVYQQRCVQCHGVSGDGNGDSAKFMYPRPRDYRKGIFKFTSVPYGFRPMREDLLRTVRQGVRGTSMPGFPLLPDQDQRDVVEYVISLSRRGELEGQLIDLAGSDDEVDPEVVESDLVPAVLNRWLQSESSEVFPVTPQPRFTQEHVERGQKAFLSKGCSKCHGDDGRGQTLDNFGKTDAWGFHTRAADLTSGMLHGGNRPLDIYRRIYNGINGTPMPSFANALKEEPDTIWDLVAYALSVSNRRRRGEIPPPGAINPYVPTTSTAKPAEE
ncbi:MAG: c-type cytochrome [Planctomycetes bacterium]|nr:c-type cytochrome [Planctomycetota bacterium]